MRRADRLLKITHYLRQRRRAVTARQIAEHFDICSRTVYRDIQCLMDAGAPIRGEAGTGYIIDKEYYLPPVTFDSEELEAISLGISMVSQWTDDKFTNKAQSAFDKIKAVLPAAHQSELQQITTYAMPNRTPIPWTISFSDLREYIRAREKIEITYIDAEAQSTNRTIRPLALFFFNPVWLLASWCEKRQDFRNFRLDRIQNLTVCGERFENEIDKSLEAFIERESSCHNNIN